MTGNEHKGTMKNGEVDESLYSRQIYVMGSEGMKKLADTNVLISGLNGLGLEIAKNIVLGGFKSVTLHDPDDMKCSDLSSNYYTTPSDLKKNRCAVCKPKLAELNSYVSIHVLESKELTDENLPNYDVVVLARGTSSDWKAISSICRKHSIKLICAKTSGLFGQLFCDFGPKFTVVDGLGEQPASVMIQSIDQVSLIK